jgi:hypothetical protein
MTEVDNISARELIKILLDLDDLDMEIIIKDKEGNRVHGVSIVTIENHRLGALFG